MRGRRKVTGVSIHWVDEFYDHGQLVGQCVVPVLDGDIPETLEQRVLERGHRFLIETLASLLAP
jgi:phosphoribosylglycinamide formyltransferase 1